MAFWTIKIEEWCSISGLWVYCQSAVASAKARVGIWAVSSTTGHATGNPLLTAAESDFSGTGYKDQTFTAVVLAPGYYKGGVAMSGTAAYRGVGSPTPICDEGHASGSTSVAWGWNSAWTYSGTALPDVTGFTFSAALGATLPSTAPPYCRFKITRV